MSQYFPKPYESFGEDINMKINLSNYAAKTHLKNISHVDVSSFAIKSNLGGLKSEADKLDIDKLAPAPVYLRKLSDEVKLDVAKKTVYDKLVKKLDIDTLAHVPVDLSKLSDVVKNDVVKKTAYDKLVEKVNNVDTTGFVLNNTYHTDKSALEIKLLIQTKKFLLHTI